MVFCRSEEAKVVRLMDMPRVLPCFRKSFVEAQERIRELGIGLGSEESVPLTLPLTPMKRRLLLVLLNRPMATKSNLMVTVLGKRVVDGGSPKPKIIDVQVCHLRRRLAPLGIQIETQWGEGYGMSPESEAIIRGMAAAEMLG